MRGGVAGALERVLARRRGSSAQHCAEAETHASARGRTRSGCGDATARRGALLAASALAPWLAGCDPIINVQGAFFPAWVLCILAGLALTGLAHRALVALRIQEHLVPAVLVYPSMVVLFTMAVWLLVYRS